MISTLIDSHLLETRLWSFAFKINELEDRHLFQNLGKSNSEKTFDSTG